MSKICKTHGEAELNKAGRCIPCRREASKRCYEKNRETWLERNRKWKANNPELNRQIHNESAKKHYNYEKERKRKSLAVIEGHDWYVRKKLHLKKPEAPKILIDLKCDLIKLNRELKNAKDL